MVLIYALKLFISKELVLSWMDEYAHLEWSHRKYREFDRNTESSKESHNTKIT
jgi:hypothetical protein